MDVTKLSIKSINDGYKKKEFSVLELTKAYIERIEKYDSQLNTFITLTKEQALQDAKDKDKVLSKDVLNNPLFGIPLAHKDLFSTKGIQTTAASNVLKDYIPVYDATVVARLKQKGTILLGKLNCDAWAHGSSGENSDFGATKNPYNTDYVPGGSSSGSAASVAASLTPMATGTDTGGSIRQPASFTNTVGLKPTYGLVSRYGVISMASSLDTIGHITKTVEDSALILNATAGNDPLDATSTQKPTTDYTTDLNKPIKGLKIGTDPDFFSKTIHQQNADKLKDAYNLIKNDLKADMITDLSLPHQKYGIESYYVIQPSEVSSNLARYDGIRYGRDRSFFGEEAKRRIILGTFALSSGYYEAYYKKAMQTRTLIRQDFERAFEKVDAIIAPVSPTPPWKLGEKVNDPLEMYLSDKFTVTTNLAGLPSLSVPIGFTNDGLPVGIQIIGPQFSERKLFQIGHAYQMATAWHKKSPNL